GCSMLRRCRWVLACWAVVAVSRPAAGQLIINIVPGSGLSNNPVAVAAFNRAAQQWSSRFTNPVTVTITADLQPLGAGVVASTNPFSLLETYTQVRAQMIADAA